MSRHSNKDPRALLASSDRRDPRFPRRAIRDLLRSGGKKAAPPPSGGELDYDDVLARAEQIFSLFLAEDKPVKDPPAVLLAELVPGASLQGDLPSQDLRRAIPTLTKWLILRSHTARYGDPKEMLHWGLMARLAADSCSVQAAGSKQRLADLKARALSQFGNALRVCGRFREAGEMLTAAWECLAAGTGDVALRALCCQHMAPLHISQGSFDSATTFLKKAEQIYEAIEETHQLAGVLLQKGLISQYTGEPDRALRLIERAIPLLDLDEDPALLLVARNNQVLAFASTDQPDRALSSFRSLQNSDWRGRPVMKLRASWVGGKLLSDIGYPEAAEEALCSARSSFIEKDLAPEVVAVSRDLAGLYRKMGRNDKLERIVLETQALFFGIPAEAEVLKSLQELERMAFV